MDIIVHQAQRQQSFAPRGTIALTALVRLLRFPRATTTLTLVSIIVAGMVALQAITAHRALLLTLPASLARIQVHMLRCVQHVPVVTILIQVRSPAS